MATHVRELHRRASFWYSRLVLLHAMTDLVIALRRAGLLEAEASDARQTIAEQARRQPCPKATNEIKGVHTASDEHAFVVATAKLCDACLSKVEGLPPGENAAQEMREIRQEHIWDDEGIAVGDATGTLNQRALQLLGDVAVLLNLNEKGPRGKPGVPISKKLEREDFDLRDAFGKNDHLPACLSDRRGRRRITIGECAHDCPFNRCPYPENAHRAHREMSKLCRQLRRTIDEAKLGVPEWSPKGSELAYSQF